MKYTPDDGRTDNVGQYQQLVDRMVRAARLDRTLYNEVATDATATRQATAVVIMASVASALAPFVTKVAGGGVNGGLGIALITTLFGILSWLAWAAVSWWVGTRMINTSAEDVEFWQVARAMGFAHAPGVLAVAAIVPGVAGIISFVSLFWLLATGFMATRASMRLTDGQAVLTMIAGFIPAFLFVGIVVYLVDIAIGGTILGSSGSPTGIAP